MKHIKVLNETVFTCKGKGCGECATSCQSAAKTSVAVAYQECENKHEDNEVNRKTNIH